MNGVGGVVLVLPPYHASRRKRENGWNLGEINEIEPSSRVFMFWWDVFYENILALEYYSVNALSVIHNFFQLVHVISINFKFSV